MKTTEVFVEQVLIGLLVILNFGLIFFQDIGSQFKLDFQTGAAVVAVAYLVGIVFDRFADTLLEDIERHNRLRFALRGKNPPFTKDPFPEDKYRMRVLQNHEAFAYSTYIRTRMRLSRAMAILIPGLSVSFLLYETRTPIGTRIALAMLAAVIYGGALVAQLIRYKVNSNADKEKRNPRWYKPPRTNDRDEDLIDYKEKEKRIWWFALQEPSVWALTYLTALVFVLASTICRAFLAVPIASIALTLLTGWTWWRITVTFMAFLRDFYRATNEKPSGRTTRDKRMQRSPVK